MITVLLPGAVEAEKEILKEGVRSVEDGEPDDVHSLVSYVIQSQQRKFLWEDSKDEFHWVKQANLLEVKNILWISELTKA